MRRRLRLIPFEYRFVDEHELDRADSKQRPKNPNLLEELKEEGPGILAWLLAGNMIAAALKRNRGNVSATDRELQIDRRIVDGVDPEHEKGIDAPGPHIRDQFAQGGHPGGLEQSITFGFG